MKTKEELNALKEEVETLNKKLAELNEEEMKQVVGGADADEEIIVTAGYIHLVCRNCHERFIEPSIVKGKTVSCPVCGSPVNA